MINKKQKENIAQFYNNLALAVITFGIIGPVYTKINNYAIFFLQTSFSMIGALILLQISQKFLK